MVSSRLPESRVLPKAIAPDSVECAREILEFNHVSSRPVRFVVDDLDAPVRFLCLDSVVGTQRFVELKPVARIGQLGRIARDSHLR